MRVGASPTTSRGRPGAGARPDLARSAGREAALEPRVGGPVEPVRRDDRAQRQGPRDRGRVARPGDAIAREVFEREPPLNFPYEFLNIGGKKMSTSKGLGAAAHTIAEIVPPEQLRFLFLRPRPESAIEFDPEGTDAIPRLFDEFDRLAAATAGREVKGELPRASSRSSATRSSMRTRTSRPRRARSGPPFAHLALLVQVPGVDVAARGEPRRAAPDRRGGGGARGPPRRGPPLARGVRAGARRPRDPARRPPGRGRAAPPRAARLPAGARRASPTATRPRPASSGRPRSSPSPRTTASTRRRLQRAVPRVPRPAQRPAGGLAAREPRPRLRRPAAPGGRRSCGEALA